MGRHWKYRTNGMKRFNAGLLLGFLVAIPTPRRPRAWRRRKHDSNPPGYFETFKKGYAVDARRDAFTLIELLVALFTTAVVVGICAALYNLVLRMGEQQSLKKAEVPVVSCIHELSRDLACAAPYGSASQTVFSIYTTNIMGATWSVVEFVTSRPDTTNTQKRWAHLEYVRWRPLRIMDNVVLVKEQAPLRGAGLGIVRTNTILEEVVGFTLLAAQEGTWIQNLQLTGESNWPDMVRIQLHISNKGISTNWQTDVFMPVSMVVTSNVADERQ